MPLISNAKAFHSLQAGSPEQEERTMKVVIYGAGAIGGVVGGHLACAGYDVALIGRSAQVEAIQEHGLRLVTPSGTHVLRLPAVTGPGQINFGPDHVVLLCMKSQNTEEALRDLRAVTGEVPLFCLQNGVRNEEIAAQYFPRVYGVMVRVGADYLNNGEVIARRDPPGLLIIGRYPQGTNELVEAVAASMRAAGFLVMVTPDVMPYKWGKLIINLGNAIGAISNARGEEINLIEQATRREARDILTQAGIRWVSTQQLTKEWPESNAPPQGSIDTKTQGSTWQSLARRQGTVETDFLNGEIVRLARQLGRQAPLNEALLRISHQMAANRETPGKYGPAQLRALLGL